MPEYTKFGLKDLVSIDKIKGIITEMERLAADEIESYDRWVIIRTVMPLSFFKKNKCSFAKALRLEEQVFTAA